MAVDSQPNPLSPRGFPQATRVLCRWQKIAAILFVVGLVAWGVFDFRRELLIVNGVLMAFYLLTTLYRLLIILLALTKPREWNAPPEALQAPPDGKAWPKYLVILPLYKEKDILPNLVAGLSKLDYPVDRLEIRLLIEADDDETLNAARSMNLQPPFVITLIPVSQPRTKPKACNIGMQDSDAEYLVIYDAEDRPEPDQLKKAALAFSRLPENIACIQAKLGYYNPNQNLLTKCFTADYATWFGLCLPGLDALQAPIPLGGTSNHFKLSVLREVGGWDEYNVTEDCDLGLRLFQAGWRTRILESSTWEQACPRLGAWIRQRSRWVKGYMQTYLVHTRDWWGLHRRMSFWNALQFHLLIGGSSLSTLINPLYWIMTLWWVIAQPPIIQEFFPPTLYAMGSFCLFIGNFIFAYTSAIACVRIKRGYLAKYCLVMPFYWMLISIAAWKGFLQLFTKPHHWEKTRHFAADPTQENGEAQK